MIKILVLLIFINSLVLATDKKSLSCSNKDRGTIVYYINGVGNSFEQAQSTSDKLDEIITPVRSQIDINSKIFFDFGHNSSEFLFLDGFQTILQKAEEVGETPSTTLLSSFLFQPLRLCKLKPTFCAAAAGGIGLLSLGQTYISQQDINKIANVIKAKIEDGFKVIVVSHSQGNLYANYIYDKMINNGLSRSLIEKYYGNLQVGSAASQSQSKKFRFYTLRDDFIINQLRLLYPSIFPPEYLQISEHESQDSFLSHGMVETYLNQNFFVNGPKQSGAIVSRTSAKVFTDLLEEIAWMLDNNDTACCDGEDGRFYRKDYETPATKLFVSSTSKIADGVIVQSDDKSQLCGKVSVENIGDARTLYLEDSVITGDGDISIKGNVFIEDSTIENVDTSRTLSLENGSLENPLVIQNSTLEGSPRFQGPLNFLNSGTLGVPSISGTIYNSPDGAFSPTIAGSTITGNSNFSGFYTINGRRIENTFINGSVLEVNGRLGSLVIDSNLRNKNLIKGSHFEGFGYFAGSIEDGVDSNGQPFDGRVYLRGERVGNVVSGIIVDELANINTYADLTRTLLLEGTTNFSGTWNGDVVKEGQFIGHATDSTFKDINILGAPRIINSTFIRGEIFRGSPIQNPFICDSFFSSAVNVSCTASVRRENQIRSYGCGYSSALNCITSSQKSFIDRIDARKWELMEMGLQVSSYYSQMLVEMNQ